MALLQFSSGSGRSFTRNPLDSLGLDTPTKRWAAILGGAGLTSPLWRGEEGLDPVAGAIGVAGGWLIGTMIEDERTQPPPEDNGNGLPPSPEGPRGNRPTR